MKHLALLLVATVTLLVAPACKTPGGAPPPVGAGGVEGVDGGAGVNCVTDVTQHAIAAAQSRAITVISGGVTSGFTEDAILVNLEQMVTDLAPSAIACALQYLGIKLDYDSQHAQGEAAKEKLAESKVARAYLRKHAIRFAPLPAN